LALILFDYGLVLKKRELGGCAITRPGKPAKNSILGGRELEFRESGEEKP